MDEDLRRLTYDAARIPVRERGPIAAFQLYMIDQAGNPELNLDILDGLELIVLLGRNEDTAAETLCGAAYIGETSLAGVALLGLYWTRPGIPDRASHVLLAEVDDWMAERDLERVVGFARRHPRGWSRTGRFEIERRR